MKTHWKTILRMLLLNIKLFYFPSVSFVKLALKHFSVSSTVWRCWLSRSIIIPLLRIMWSLLFLLSIHGEKICHFLILFEMLFKWFLMNDNLVLFSYRSLESDQTGPVSIWGEETWRHSEDVMCHIWVWHDRLLYQLDTTETRESSGMDRVDEHRFKFC